MASQLSYLVDSLSREKWLNTCHGYNSCTDCILYDSKWSPVSDFADLPFIDEAFYGSRIYLFKDELKLLGVVVGFNEGAHILARGLNLPNNAKTIPADSAKAFLHCAHSLRYSAKSSDLSSLQQLVAKLKRHKWVKTYMGYRAPEESLIFNWEWITDLEEKDGPFVDEGFYGTLSSLEIDELKALDVKVDTSQVCTSMFQNLSLHDETAAILRAFKFLCKNRWSLSSGSDCMSQLWIPDRLGPKGKWVEKTMCVLHDRDNLFGSLLHILDRHYDKEILSFISINFGVDTAPTLGKYVDLWASWARNSHCFSFRELNSFWGYISENWDKFLEKNLGKGISVLPATTVLGTVQLMVRDEVFIPDDLRMRKEFADVSESPIFVWFPQSGSTSLTRLYEIYKSLGVRKLSKSVQFSTNCNFEKLVSKGSLIGKPLIKLVLAFLGSPAVNLLVEERQWKSKSLLDIPLYGADNLIVNCSLHFPVSNKILNVELKKLVLWDKDLPGLLVHKPSWNRGHIQKNMEFIFDFSQAISEVVLPNATDPTDDLCRIIKMGLAFGFKEDEVDSLLQLENLELSTLDKNFLECLFPAVTASSPASAKHQLPSPTQQNIVHKKLRMD